MKSIKLAIIILTIMMFSTGSAPKMICQESDKPAVCSQPVMLKLSLDGRGELQYSVDGRVIPHYPLNELANAVYLCKPQRPVYVLADSLVPVGKVLGAVMAKIQVDNVRYFIVYPTHLVVEINVVSEDFKMP